MSKHSGLTAVLRTILSVKVTQKFLTLVCLQIRYARSPIMSRNRFTERFAGQYKLRVHQCFLPVQSLDRGWVTGRQVVCNNLAIVWRRGALGETSGGSTRYLSLKLRTEIETVTSHIAQNKIINSPQNLGCAEPCEKISTVGREFQTTAAETAKSLAPRTVLVRRTTSFRVSTDFRYNTVQGKVLLRLPCHTRKKTRSVVLYFSTDLPSRRYRPIPLSTCYQQPISLSHSRRSVNHGETKVSSRLWSWEGQTVG